MKRREFVLLRYSVFFTLLYILVGCTENRVQMQRLQVIDSLMEAHPQAAYDSLCRFDSLEMGNASRTVAMKCRMLMAKAQNKLYLSMPTDSIFQEVWIIMIVGVQIMRRCKLIICWVACIVTTRMRQRQ